MLVLAIFEFILLVSDSLMHLAFGAAPEQLVSVVAYILQMIEDGWHILTYCFVDLDVIAPLAQWYLASWAIFFMVDMIWYVVGLITLRRTPKDPN